MSMRFRESNMVIVRFPLDIVIILSLWILSAKIISEWKCNFVTATTKGTAFPNPDGSRNQRSSRFEGWHPRRHPRSPDSTDQSDWQAGHPAGAQWDENWHERYVLFLDIFLIVFLFNISNLWPPSHISFTKGPQRQILDKSYYLGLLR